MNRIYDFNSQEIQSKNYIEAMIQCSVAFLSLVVLKSFNTPTEYCYLLCS